MSKIIMVSPFPDLTRAARQVALEMRLAVEFVEGVVDERGWLHDGSFFNPAPSDVLVSRGGTAFQLARQYESPVVRIGFGPFDILRCCNEAKKLCPRIAITSFEPLPDLSLVGELLGLEISLLQINDIAVLERQILELAQSGDYCVVGGGPSVRIAAKYGLPHVFWQTGQESIRDAFVRAVELVKLLEWNQKENEKLKAVLDCAHEAIISIDEQHRIELFNHTAAQMLGVRDAEAVVGRPILEVVPASRLPEVVASGEPQLGVLQDVSGLRVITNRLPVRMNNEIKGAVASFNPVAEILQIEHQLRRGQGQSGFKARHCFADIKGSSRIIQQKKKLAQSFARSPLTVFINGPTGTGKELFAQSIHQGSSRRPAPFVAVNCGAFPPSLLESELFGYAEGAFTGARRQGKQGLFELAHKGSIFLDEIDAMPFEMQGRLLRVLQEREVFRIGDQKTIPVDIRIIAASNKPPKTLLRDKMLREDLFYRLNVLYLDLPPLREHKEDIPELCREYVGKRDSARMHKLLDSLMPRFLEYDWPGNMRELANVIQRLSFYTDSVHGSVDELLAFIAPDILSTASGKRAAGNEEPGEDAGTVARGDSEEDRLLLALSGSPSLAEAAARLGVSRTTLWRKMRRLGGRA